MLQIFFEWRKENKLVGNLELEALSQDFKKAVPITVLGVNKNGYLIIFNPMDRHDIS